MKNKISLFPTCNNIKEQHLFRALVSQPFAREILFFCFKCLS